MSRRSQKAKHREIASIERIPASRIVPPMHKFHRIDGEDIRIDNGPPADEEGKKKYWRAIRESYLSKLSPELAEAKRIEFADWDARQAAKLNAEQQQARVEPQE